MANHNWTINLKEVPTVEKSAKNMPGTATLWMEFRDENDRIQIVTLGYDVTGEMDCGLKDVYFLNDDSGDQWEYKSFKEAIVGLIEEYGVNPREKGFQEYLEEFNQVVTKSIIQTF
jgi:hypothetical protein